MSVMSGLFDLVESGIVLVFPTEESARAFSVRYVQERKRGLKASSVIAFDTFYSLLLSSDGGRTAAGDVDRLLFSEYAASVLSDRFRYFVSHRYPEVKERLAPYLRSMLQGLPESHGVSKRDGRAEADIALLEHEYRRYLVSLGLYEPSFEELSVPVFSADHALVMPSAFPKEERAVEALEGNPRVRFIEAPFPSGLTIRRYGNEKEEIRALFIAIRSLLDDGVPFSDIVISTSAEERLRPYLEEESYLFDIPLEFVAGRSPLSYPSGAFLSSLSEIYTTRYSLQALKRFFLNPAIPFRDHDALVSFIEFAVANSISSAPSFEHDRYLRIPKAMGGDWYRTLRFTLDKLMAETDPERIIPELHALMGGLLADEQFSGNAEDADVYSFAMDALSSFLSAVRRAEEKGYSSSRPLFPLFISYLRDTRYVPRGRGGGVRVYPLTQDAALAVRHRFIIALNDEESARTVRKASFLSDYEIEGERSEEDITRDIIACYSSFSDDLVLSASSETYAGFALPLSILESVDSYAPDDPWRSESSFPECGRIYPLQRTGFERGHVTAMRDIPAEEDLTSSLHGVPLEKPLRISFSSFDDYRHCPFVYALRHRFGLDRPLSFEVATLDAAEMGNRLHRVLERFYQMDERSADEDIPRIFSEEMEAWKSGEGMGAYAMRATDLIVSYLRSVYLGNLIEVARRMDELSRPLEEGGLESWLSRTFEEEGFLLSGKIDRLAFSAAGEGLVIFDYKSRGSFSGAEAGRKGYQMYIYRLLTESAYEGKGVDAAYFVTLRDGAVSSFPMERSDEDIIGEIAAAASSMAEGDWHAISSDENCQGCDYRSICRRRFVVR